MAVATPLLVRTQHELPPGRRPAGGLCPVTLVTRVAQALAAALVLQKGLVFTVDMRPSAAGLAKSVWPWAWQLPCCRQEGWGACSFWGVCCIRAEGPVPPLSPAGSSWPPFSFSHESLLQGMSEAFGLITRRCSEGQSDPLWFAGGPGTSAPSTTPLPLGR